MLFTMMPCVYLSCPSFFRILVSMTSLVCYDPRCIMSPLPLPSSLWRRDGRGFGGERGRRSSLSSSHPRTITTTTTGRNTTEGSRKLIMEPLIGMHEKSVQLSIGTNSNVIREENGPGAPTTELWLIAINSEGIWDHHIQRPSH